MNQLADHHSRRSNARCDSGVNARMIRPCMGCDPFEAHRWPPRSKAIREPASASRAEERSLPLGTAKEKGSETGGGGDKTGCFVGATRGEVELIPSPVSLLLPAESEVKKQAPGVGGREKPQGRRVAWDLEAAAGIEPWDSVMSSDT